MILKNINVKERMKHYHVPGLSITFIDDGRITAAESYGLLETDTSRHVNNNSIFNACSISKFLTGLLVMKLKEEGLLDLDEDVNKRLRSFHVPSNEYTKNVTLRNLLSHQSGIKDPEGSFSELKSDLPAPSMVQLLEGKTTYCNEPIAVKYEPQREFQYSDAGFCIVQQLIEDVTKKHFSDLVDELIFQPLHMKDSTYLTSIPGGKEARFSCGHNKLGEVMKEKYPVYPYPAASGLWASSVNLAQLQLELMNALKGKSKIGISKKSAEEMIAPQGKNWTGLALFLDGPEQNLEISSLGWGIGFQCMLVAYPHLGKGLAIMTNAELGFHQMDGIIGEIYQALVL